MMQVKFLPNMHVREKTKSVSSALVEYFKMTVTEEHLMAQYSYVALVIVLLAQNIINN